MCVTDPHVSAVPNISPQRLCPRPPDPGRYWWKAEALSFLYVLLVWGVALTSLIIKSVKVGPLC